MLLPLALSVGFSIDPCCSPVTIGPLKPWNNLARWWQVINCLAKCVSLHLDDPKMVSLVSISSPISYEQNEVWKNAIPINMHDMIFSVRPVFAEMGTVKYLCSFDNHTHLYSCYRLNLWNKSLRFSIFLFVFLFLGPATCSLTGPCIYSKITVEYKKNVEIERIYLYSLYLEWLGCVFLTGIVYFMWVAPPSRLTVVYTIIVGLPPYFLIWLPPPCTPQISLGLSPA